MTSNKHSINLIQFLACQWCAVGSNYNMHGSFSGCYVFLLMTSMHFRKQRKHLSINYWHHSFSKACFNVKVALIGLKSKHSWKLFFTIKLISLHIGYGLIHLFLFIENLNISACIFWIFFNYIFIFITVVRCYCTNVWY